MLSMSCGEIKHRPGGLELGNATDVSQVSMNKNVEISCAETSAEIRIAASDTARTRGIESRTFIRPSIQAYGFLPSVLQNVRLLLFGYGSECQRSVKAFFQQK
jgi:hypothetical protein